MEAGRELDKVIGERVMGWKWLNAPAVGEPFMLSPEQISRYTPEFVEQNTVKDCDLDAPSRLPHYSTSIADAWLVVEKLRERESIARSNGASDQAWVSFVWNLPMSRHGIHYMLFSLTPLAICLAALKTMEVPNG